MPTLISPDAPAESSACSKNQVPICLESIAVVPPRALSLGDCTPASPQTGRLEMADQELIGHLLTGDRDASGRFVRRFERLIHHQLYALHVPPQDHEDLFQEVFLHLWEQDCRRLRLWQGRGKGLFSSYLRAVIRRLICDKRRARAVPIPMEDIPGAPGEATEDPEILLLSLEQKTAIRQALVGLSHRDRELLCRRYFNDESYKEIAASMGLTVAHVGVALARAEQHLKKAFSIRYPDLHEIR